MYACERQNRADNHHKCKRARTHIHQTHTDPSERARNSKGERNEQMNKINRIPSIKMTEIDGIWRMAVDKMCHLFGEYRIDAMTSIKIMSTGSRVFLLPTGKHFHTPTKVYTVAVILLLFPSFHSYQIITVNFLSHFVNKKKYSIYQKL